MLFFKIKCSYPIFNYFVLFLYNYVFSSATEFEKYSIKHSKSIRRLATNMYAHAEKNMSNICIHNAANDGNDIDSNNDEDDDGDNNYYDEFRATCKKTTYFVK